MTDTKRLDDSLKVLLKDLLKEDLKHHSYDRIMVQLRRRYKISPTKRDLGLLYTKLHEENPTQYPWNPILADVLRTKSVRSDSGVLNVSIALPPNQFSCCYNCYFCPNEPGLPRSYLSNEDVFMRAKEVDFDTVGQIHSRLNTLKENGHPIDKIEIRVLGGTFSCYPRDLADIFIRDIYYGANIYLVDEKRDRLSIEEEQYINTTSAVHIVGLGIETRPDRINEREVIRFRRYGVTRVEIGVQHTDDRLLKLVNRGHTLAHSKSAIKLLKDYGFKVEIHIMADLPGATPEGDMDCYRQILRDDPDLIPDYMKDYPCLDVSYTVIKQWKENGQWVPYAERTPDAKDLINVLVYRQQITPKWVRVNRVQRDFCLIQDNTQVGYTSQSVKPNLGELIKTDAEKRGIYCQCIRCREVRQQAFDPHEITYVVESFLSSGGQEYFISAEVARPHRHLLLGFIRLRLSDALYNSVIHELKGKTAMIRELHVYGRLKKVGHNQTEGAQHLGIGHHLLEMAEHIAKDAGYERIAVISGIGVRNYYHKYEYHLMGTYMIKQI